MLIRSLFCDWKVIRVKLSQVALFTIIKDVALRIKYVQLISEF